MIDASELRTLAADLTAAGGQAEKDARAVVQKGALNVKTDWRARWTGLVHAPHVAASITYDTHIRPWGVEGEIGPDKGRRQGALGNLLEFGSVKNAPIPGGAPALDAEAPRFEKALENLLGGLL